MIIRLHWDGSCRFGTESGMDGERLNKFLSAAGVCSRREADRRIELGQVCIDGQTAGVGDRVMPGQTVTFQGREIRQEEKPVLLAYYKPRGIVCTASRKEKDNIIDYMKYPSRIYPVGRLDKDSEGLILMTNQGGLMERISHARYFHEKEYLVKVNRPVDPGFLQKMSRGVEILDTVTRPCKVMGMGKDTFSIILTQGLNRQIRRMCEALGYRVVELKRIRIMNIQLGTLTPGTYREIQGEELKQLKRMLPGE